MMIKPKTIITEHGKLKTPVFMPDATFGAIRSISFKDAKKAKTRAIVTTTLHIENTITSQFIKKFGGIHKFFNWNEPILSDSGGFQVFSLIHASSNKNLNKITNAGASFVNPTNGQTKFLSPEISQIIQYNLKTDIVTALDEPTIRDAPLSVLKSSIQRNTLWAKRSKQKFLELHNLTENDFNNPKIKRPLIGAVIQGGNNLKLRKESAKQLLEIGFDMYNFGGMPLHNKNSWKNNAPKGFYHELLEEVAKLILDDKIKYAMGVGTPDDIDFCIKSGWDLFDTVLPTRNARHGLLYVSKGAGDKHFKNYDTIHIKSLRYKYDKSPIDHNCNCTACKNVSRSYLRHLIRIKEPSGFRLATIHNLTFFNNFVAKYNEN